MTSVRVACVQLNAKADLTANLDEAEHCQRDTQQPRQQFGLMNHHGGSDQKLSLDYCGDARCADIAQQQRNQPRSLMFTEVEPVRCSMHDDRLLCR